MTTRTFLVLLGFLVVAFVTAAASANPMSVTENFVDRPGGDYHHYNAGSFAQCSSSCATNAQCKAYTYVLSSGICWLKDTVPRGRSDNCCVSGVKLMGAQEMSFDRPGYDIRPGFSVVTSGQCETACKNELICRAYTFVKPGVQAETGMCWLKNRRPAKVNNGCCVSGVRLRDAVRVPTASGNLQARP